MHSNIMPWSSGHFKPHLQVLLYDTKERTRTPEVLCYSQYVYVCIASTMHSRMCISQLVAMHSTLQSSSRGEENIPNPDNMYVLAQSTVGCRYLCHTTSSMHTSSLHSQYQLVCILLFCFEQCTFILATLVRLVVCILWISSMGTLEYAYYEYQLVVVPLVHTYELLHHVPLASTPSSMHTVCIILIITMQCQEYQESSEHTTSQQVAT